MQDIVKKTESAAMQSMKCPKCKKRAFDIHKSVSDSVVIQLKCPHCHQIVNITVDKSS